MADDLKATLFTFSYNKTYVYGWAWLVEFQSCTHIRSGHAFPSWFSTDGQLFRSLRAFDGEARGVGCLCNVHTDSSQKVKTKEKPHIVCNSMLSHICLAFRCQHFQCGHEKQ